jgi:acid phosphatase type 7
MTIIGIILLLHTYLIQSLASNKLEVDRISRSRFANLATFEIASVKEKDYIRPLGASQLAPPTTIASCSSQQVHVSMGNQENEMFITFVSSNFSINYSSQDQPCVVIGESLADVMNYDVNKPATASLTSATTLKCWSESYSQLIWITSGLYAPYMGGVTEPASDILTLQNTSVWAYSIVNGTKMTWANYKYLAPGSSPVTGLGQYNNPYMVYDSPIVNTAEVKNLLPGHTYYYRPLDSCDEVFDFIAPSVSSGKASDYPMTVGIVMDLGQTVVSNASMAALLALDPSVVLLAGDLSYADGWYPRWDSFGNLVERLASRVPILTTGGNHEFASSESWMSYNARYPTPFEGADSTHPCYYGKEIGVMHLLALCSYAGFSNTSLQYAWLTEYLSTSINRTKTPWLVAMMHVPWYSSNSGHWMEGELMRRSMESILYSYGVDLVLTGHVHVYERTLPVYNNALDECGPVHMTIGDGGNYEGTYVPWLVPQPSWSAFRESSFGVAGLEFLNDTTASYSWHRHACQSNGGTGDYYHVNFSDSCISPGDNSAYRMLTSDVAYISRPSIDKCPNRWISTKTTVDVASTDDDGDSSDDSSSDDDQDGVVIGLAVTVAILGAVVIALAAALYLEKKRSVSAATSAQNATINESPIHSKDAGLAA